MPSIDQQPGNQRSIEACQLPFLPGFNNPIPDCVTDDRPSTSDAICSPSSAILRIDGPRRKPRRGKRDRPNIVSAKGCREPSRLFANQPIAGEARYDAAADNHDENDDRSQAEAAARIGYPDEMGFDMKQDICHQKGRDRQQHLEVPPVSTGDDFRRCCNHYGNKK